MVRLGARQVLAATVPALMLALSSCGTSDVAADSAAPSSPATVSTPQPPLTAGAPSESELTPGWDESPDGPSPTPDADLTDSALKALLRTRATAASQSASCRPGDVTARLAGFDAGLGHRYTWLVVKNTSSRTCGVEGVPGVGARGDWGHRLTLTVEPGTANSGTTELVRLKPGMETRAQVEWTGELAGDGAERASLLVIQLASGQVPVPLSASITDLPTDLGSPEEMRSLDVGMLTKLRMGPFERRA